MSSQTEKIDFTPIEIPQVHRSPWGILKIGLVLVLIGGALVAWQMGYWPSMWGQDSKAVFQLVEVDRGDIDIAVVETGTVESANNATLRCQVEALLGTVGGQGAASGKMGGAGSGGAGQGGGGAAGGASGGAGGASGTSGGTQQTTAKAKTTAKAGSSSTGTTTTAGTSKSSSSSATSSTAATGASSTSGSASSTSTGTTTTTGGKPVIRSFTYAAVPYVSLRPAATKSVDTAAQKKAQGGQGGMGGGGGGGRGGGGGGGGRGGGGRNRMQPEEAPPGSAVIVYLIPEGSQVKAGELVCELDSSAFQDEEKAQLIRFLQANSYVEQAASSLEVAKISLREYRDGIYPQDLQLVKQYIEACELDRDRLKRAAEWSRDMATKGFRTEFQAKGDAYAYQQSQIALVEAQNMFSRLVNQTGPKVLKSLEANVKAIEADKFTQDAAFNLEKTRLERIRKNIKNCSLKAPNDGIVVYVNQANSFGMVTYPIAEGLAVRQDQPIINLPDPLHMRVKARINESKLSLVHTGQVARIVIDAFRDHPLKGRVSEVNAINTPLNASDVRVYYANVDIAAGFADLRPGLSAEVSFLVDSRRNATRVPLDAIRWVHERGYVALYDPAAKESKKQWRWKEIHVGLSDLNYAEVLSGVEPGDRVVATPRDLLPQPTPEPLNPAATKVAELAP